MRVSVLIRRQRAEEPATGTLRAYVVQHSKRGSNLLAGRSITSVESAKREIEKRLWVELGDQMVLISWTLDEPDLTRPATTPRATPMDGRSRDAAADAVGRDWRKMAPGGGRG